MKTVKSLGLLCLVIAFSVAAVPKGPTSITGDQALAKLVAGNKRFVKSALLHPNQTAARRKAVAKGQTPFAIVLSCSDSRVPPEVAFDQGLGDLFVIRVAGNTVNNEGLGSIEYAVDHFGSPLIMVLGHQRCGAVDAAVKGGEAPGHIGSVVEPIKPAVEKTRGMPGDPVDNAVRANVELVVEQLKDSKPIISEAIRNGKLKVVGARYDLDSGRVEIIK
jgi:carbonic anhydrase